MTKADPTVTLKGLQLTPADYPHGSNLHTKSMGILNAAKTTALKITVPAYLELYAKSLDYEKGTCSLKNLLSEVEDYSALIKTPEVKSFSHQSDFISSLLPELFCVLLRKEIHDLKLDNSPLVVTAQKDIVIECNYDISLGGRIIEKRKRMDVAVLASGTLSFNDKSIDFSIPAICAEIKTNIDKNMLSGIESSVETLKRTFPRVLYYAIGEYSDFQIETQNYASTKIDEILIVRNQKRSTVRKDPSALQPISESLLVSFLEEVRSHLKSTFLTSTSLASRMLKGKLT